MAVTNKKSKEEIKKEVDEVLEATPPSEVKPVEPKLEDLLAKNPEELTAEEMDSLSDNKEDLTEEQLVAVGLKEEVEEKEEDIVPEPPIPEVKPVEPIVEPPKPVIEPVLPPVEVKEVTEPTEDDLKKYVMQDGVSWDELTQFEKSTAKRNFIIEKRQEAISDGLKGQQKLGEWSKKLDTFIDSTDSDPKYSKLSGHEAEFKRYALTHPDSDIETLLLPAFLFNLPASSPKRGNLFEKGGGGIKQEPPKTDVDDADYAKKLRENNPREYKRLLKAGKIKLGVD